MSLTDLPLPDMLVVILTLGFVVGSFLNVVIHRLPEHRSLWGPRSTCPACDSTIAWYDNIPILSFVHLRGRCRACQNRISWRYPFVEAGTAVLFGIAWFHFGATPEFPVATVLLAALVAITAIDLDHQIIPDAITLPGICVGFISSLVTHHISWGESILGLAVGGGIFATIILVSGGGMGGGDMKLGAMLGTFLGWKVVLVALFLAVILGGVLAMVLVATGLRGRKDPIPFGPFLAVGAAISLFWGEWLLAWYTRGLLG